MRTATTKRVLRIAHRPSRGSRPTVSPGGSATLRTPSSTPGMNDDAVERVVPDGQRLALGAEDDLLVGDQPGDPQRVHADAVDVGAAGAVAAPGWWRPGRGRVRPSARAAAISSAVRDGGAARRVDLVRVVQLDDLGRLVEAARRAARTSSTAPRRCRSSARPARRRSGASVSHSRTVSSRSAVKPVVPTTAWMPWSMAKRMLSMTTSGWVKSTSTCAPASATLNSQSPASTMRDEVEVVGARRRPGRPAGPSGRARRARRPGSVRSSSTPRSSTHDSAPSKSCAPNGPTTVRQRGRPSSSAATSATSAGGHRVDAGQQLVDAEDVAVGELALADAGHPRAGVLEAEHDAAAHLALAALDLGVGQRRRAATASSSAIISASTSSALPGWQPA